MREDEVKAIRWIKSVRDDAIVTLDHIRKNEPHVSPMLFEGRRKKAETILRMHEELEKYRAIDTIEVLQELKEKCAPKKILPRLCDDCQRDCIDCDRYEDAEEQGLLLMLPCKVGDTIYYFMNVDDVIVIEERKMATLTNIVAILEDEEFGKTVFLTKEEAEQALKQRGGMAVHE